MPPQVKVLCVVCIGTLLFVLNNAAVVGGILETPPGYAPYFLSRASDLAQYVTWAEGFRTQNLIPNYHSALPTEPGFFNPFFWALGRLMAFTGLSFQALYQGAHLLFTVAAVAAVWKLTRTFADGHEAVAVGLMVCVLPLQSVFVPVATFIAPESRFALAGLGDVVFSTSDGLLHGISGGALVTLGTAATMYGFVLLYSVLTRGTGFSLLCLLTLAVAFLHPFEAVTIVGVGGAALMMLSQAPLSTRLRQVAVLGGGMVVGLLPYVVLTARHPWLAASAQLNHWDAPWPGRLFMMLGLPALVATILLPFAWRAGTLADRLLVLWVGGTLVLLYVPVIPWSQHLMDGFHYGCAVLVARQIALAGLLRHRFVRPALALWVVWSLATWGAYYRQSYVAGTQPRPERLFSAVEASSEREVIEWLRAYAPADAVVAATVDLAPWIATVPIRTVASHWLFSGDYVAQEEGVTRLLSGALSPEAADTFLGQYNVRYVVHESSAFVPTYLLGFPIRNCVAALCVREVLQ
jgi:hypothetical protein